MPVLEKHAEGRFCWAELSSVDVARSREFFTQLFGWTVEAIPLPEGGEYLMCSKDGKTVAAMYQQWPQQQALGIPSHFMTYVNVENLDGAFAKAVSLGGKEVMPPMDVMEEGRMAIISDPSGAMLGLWQAKRHIGAQRIMDPGSIAWCELDAPDVDPGIQFYSRFFDWQPNTGEFGAIRYTSFMQGPMPIAGAMAYPPGMNAPATWLLYFGSKDCDAVAARAAELGGGVIVPPQDMPGGRFTVLNDPTGAVFGVIHFQMEAPCDS